MSTKKSKTQQENIRRACRDFSRHLESFNKPPEPSMNWYEEQRQIKKETLQEIKELLKKF